MRALKELVGVIAVGVIAFLSTIAITVGFLLMWACGVVSGLCLMVALFAGAIFWITHTPHDGQIALTYLGYAVVTFVPTFIVGYYWSKLRHKSQRLAA